MKEEVQVITEDKSQIPTSFYRKKIRHTFFNVLSLVITNQQFKIIQVESKLKALEKGVEEMNDTKILLFAAAVLVLQIWNFYDYLKEIIIIFNDAKKGVFWLFRKFIILIANISLLFTFIYLTLYLNFPNSVKPDAIAIGNSFFEQVFNFFYFSIGNYFGYDSGIVPTSIIFKSVHIIQSFTTFLILAFVIGNFDHIKKAIIFEKNK